MPIPLRISAGVNINKLYKGGVEITKLYKDGVLIFESEAVVDTVAYYDSSMNIADGETQLRVGYRNSDRTIEVRDNTHFGSSKNANISGEQNLSPDDLGSGQGGIVQSPNQFGLSSPPDTLRLLSVWCRLRVSSDDDAHTRFLRVGFEPDVDSEILTFLQANNGRMELETTRGIQEITFADGASDRGDWVIYQEGTSTEQMQLQFPSATDLSRNITYLLGARNADGTRVADGSEEELLITVRFYI